MPEDDSYQAAVSVSEETKQKVIIVIQKLSSDFNVVLNRQLADFVPGGHYHAVTDPELQQKLAHSQITNLLGEACFGDLDLSIYKRRNASSHHHGSLTMMIRNKMMEKWFSKKEAASQKQILKVAAKKGPEFRKQRTGRERCDCPAKARLAGMSSKTQRTETSPSKEERCNRQEIGAALWSMQDSCRC